MSVAVHIQGSMSQPSGLLPRAQFIGRQGRTAFRQGGMGAKPAMHLCGPALAPPMLAGLCIWLCIFCIIFHHFWRFILVHSTRTFFHFRFYSLLHFAFIFLLLFPISILNGCATTRHRDEVIVSTLHAQSILLERLEEERAGIRQSKAFVSNAPLREAERHLEESIKALKISNEAITKALSDK